MPLATQFAFLFLSGCLLSLWLKREPRIWGTLLSLCLLSGLVAGNIAPIGLAFIICLAGLWTLYDRKPNGFIFCALIILSMSFKLRLLPGYHAYFITPKFAVGLENPLIGLFPLALLVPLAKNWKDWTGVLKGVAFGCTGIAILAILATISGATHWDFKLPSFAGARILSNLILTCIPEEGFYRGFVQKTLGSYFKKFKLGNAFALLLTSLLFSLSHIYSSPNAGILAFTFLTSLLYGGV